MFSDFLPNRDIGTAAMLAESQESSPPPAPVRLPQRLPWAPSGQASASRRCSDVLYQVLGQSWSSLSFPGNTHQPQEPVPFRQPAAHSLLSSLCPVTFSLVQEFVVWCRVRQVRRRGGELSFSPQDSQPQKFGRGYLSFSEPRFPHLLPQEGNGLDQCVLNFIHYGATVHQLFHYYLHILNLLPFNI